MSQFKHPYPFSMSDPSQYSGKMRVSASRQFKHPYQFEIQSTSRRSRQMSVGQFKRPCDFWQETPCDPRAHRSINFLTDPLTPIRSSTPPPDKMAMRRGAFAIYETLRMTAVRLASDLPVRLKLNLLKFVVIYALILLLDLSFAGKVLMQPLNIYLTVAWTSYFPLALVGLVGAMGSRKLRPSHPQNAVENPVIFMIPTVARHDTLPALKRVIDSILLCAPSHLLQYTIHIITEEGAEGLKDLQEQYREHPVVEFVVVPKEYNTPNGTCYKARANQYALEERKAHGLNGDDVFVYHGDDDTGIGPDTIWSIAKFISTNQGEFDLAQGVLTYPHQLSRSWFCKLADSVRPADDLTRFHFFTGMLGRPLAGLHGEHLLVRASTEEAIGWDFGAHVKVEDAYFGLFFALRFPGRSAFLESCSYGASPSNVSDLIKQRRRWAAGLFGLLFDRQLPLRVKWSLAYSIVNWTSGLMQHVGIILLVAYVLGSLNTGPTLQFFLFIWSFNLGYQVWMYLEGLRINLDASQASTWKYFVLPCILVPLIPVFSLIEAWAATLGLWDFLRKKKGFEVISKRI